MSILRIGMAALIICTTPVLAADGEAKFSQSARSVDPFEFVEVTLALKKPRAGNPFTDATLTGEFKREGGEPLKIEGFCDAQDGSVFRIRFMPTRAGSYSYTAKFQQGGLTFSQSGAFKAPDRKRPGIVRVDKEHPFHFVYDGTGEHFFWNGTTTYQILAWEDDATIHKSIERLAKLGVNRIRVGLCYRTKSGNRWSEPLVQPTKQFKFHVEPWLAERPDSFENPGFDVQRFNIAYCQKVDRLLLRARELGMQVSLIFYVDGRDKGVDPFGKQRMAGEDEQRYYRYVIARAAAFPNVMWDVANEYRLFRDDAWANKMGTLVKEFDPYDHLTSVHGHETFTFRKSPWADFAMYQKWDEHGGYRFMLKNREEQLKAGRPMPQINEEYGYEDHYPTGWGENRRPPARNADSRRRLAWEITMAGGYQTTGERADFGTGAGADTGGGWINGRGNKEMKMLEGYAHLRQFFENIEWWKFEPHPELAGTNAFCLARTEPGRESYVIYLPKGGQTGMKLNVGDYVVRWFNPRTGKSAKREEVNAREWVEFIAPDRGDWALLLEAKQSK